MTTYIVGKIPDNSIVLAFEALTERFGRDDWSFSSDSTSFTESLQLIKDRSAPSYLLTDAYIEPTEMSIRVRIRRTVNGQPDAFFDEIVFENLARVPPAAENLVALEDALRETIKFPHLGVQTKADNQMVGLLQKEIASIADLHKKLLADTMDLKISLEEHAAKRREQFETEQREASESLAEDEARSIDRIKQEQALLDEKLREFDISDHMRARRKQREEISEQVQSFLAKPTITSQTRLRFIFLVYVCVIAVLGAGYIAYESLQALVTHLVTAKENADALQRGLSANILAEQRDALTSAIANQNYMSWFLAGRGLISSGACVGFLIYLLNLLRKTYDEDVRQSRELQRYGMDINRASWVIETAMEMTTKEGAALPEKWIDGACSGLFQSGSAKDSEVSSLAALGAVMGLGPEVTVGPTGASFKLPPKAAKKAAADGD